MLTRRESAALIASGGRLYSYEPTGRRVWWPLLVLVPAVAVLTFGVGAAVLLIGR